MIGLRLGQPEAVKFIRAFVAPDGSRLLVKIDLRKLIKVCPFIKENIKLNLIQKLDNLKEHSHLVNGAL